MLDKDGRKQMSSWHGWRRGRIRETQTVQVKSRKMNQYMEVEEEHNPVTVHVSERPG
jgi:hypothetical protein